ncbi:MAG: ECF transporter S component [Ruminococcus sp.]|nr:ECF transporter S component [Ruminococcus sp.]
MSNTSQNKTYRLTALGILTAIIIVLQIFTTFVHFGPFSITLALIPIVVGASMFGVGAGAYLGAVFSVVVVIMCITGGDPGGFLVWSANPFMCVVMCMLKGTLAGFEAGVHYRALENTNKIVATVVAALVSPIVNTGIFILGMMIFFRDTLVSWAGDTPVLYYIIFGLTGINFLIEVGVNVILSPVVVKIVDAVKKTNR